MVVSRIKDIFRKSIPGEDELFPQLPQDTVESGENKYVIATMFEPRRRDERECRFCRILAASGLITISAFGLVNAYKNYQYLSKNPKKQTSEINHKLMLGDQFTPRTSLFLRPKASFYVNSAAAVAGILMGIVFMLDLQVPYINE